MDSMTVQIKFLNDFKAIIEHPTISDEFLFLTDDSIQHCFQNESNESVENNVTADSLINVLKGWLND